MSAEKQLKIVSVNISGKKGTGKHPVPEIVIVQDGVSGDAHSDQGFREVSLLAQESIDRFAGDSGRKTEPGEFAENITTRGMEFDCVGILDTFASGGMLLEVTEIGKECHGNECAIFREVGECVMPQEGIFCRVLQGGILKAGDELKYRQKTLLVRIITLSDRASRGDYEDRSGPAVENMLVEFFRDKRWHLRIERELLPDDRALLMKEFETSYAEGCDIVITSGGTGVGPRDFTPEVVAAFCERTIPGIIDHIRIKFGSEKPNALLSRSVAGLKGKSIIYALPGSVKAVREYMAEILKTVEHTIFMVNGVDVHNYSGRLD